MKAPEGPKALTELGEGEGQVNLIAWAGYVEDGSTDPKVDWVSDFEKETGCKVNTKIGNTSDEMVTLMRSGQYDGVSASGDATLRLIAGGDVAPVNTDLIPNYADVFDGLKDQPWNSVDGQPYGVPHGRGANLLMWRYGQGAAGAGLVGRGVRRELALQGQGHGLRQPDLHRRRGAVPEGDAAGPGDRRTRTSSTTSSSRRPSTCSRQQRGIIGEYWSDYTKEQAAFTSGDSVLGTTWQVIANLLEADKVPIKTMLPKEGATGWSDTWMISSKAKNPNCMYMWMDHIISPKANAAVAEWFGEAPVEREGVRGDRGEEPLRDLPRRGRGLLLEGRVLDDADEGLR